METFVKIKVSIVLRPPMEEIETKDKILEGAMALFMKYGVRSVTMDDIARHLGISKKTLYQHFADKDDLVYKMSETFLQKNFKRYESIAQASKNSIEELSQISVCMKQDLEQLNPSVLFDLQKYHPKAWSLWQSHKARVITQSVIQNIRKGIEEGFYRSDINPETMAIARVMLIEGAFDPEKFPRDKFNFVNVQTQLSELFVNGLCTEKGKKLYQKFKETNYQPSIL